MVHHLLREVAWPGVDQVTGQGSGRACVGQFGFLLLGGFVGPFSKRIKVFWFFFSKKNRFALAF
jgi:hypothetical protein